MLKLDLSGRIAVVTGASRGIGQAIALRLAQAGAVVVSNHHSTPPDATKKLVEDAGGSFSSYPCDVGSTESINNFVNTVLKEHSKIDILVNNAGITRDNLLIRMSETEWDDVLNVNLKSAFSFTKVAGKAMMKKRSGSIINITSVVGATGNPGQCNYAASKAGMIGFTKSASREFASRGIRLNCVAPGYIETEMTDALKEEIKEKLMQGIPLGKMGRTEQVADAVLFLASDLSGYITGETIHVNGGMYMP